MKLSTFLTDLFETGKVTIGNEIEASTPLEIETTLGILQEYYRYDSWFMPSKQPDFEPNAALWAAQFVYQTIHLAILRHIDAQTVGQLLTDFEGATTPETMYAVDLSFRYLPELLALAKGLAPSDTLVDILKTRLQRWSFSAVGIEMEDKGKTMNTDIIALHPSLQLAYVDRIIQNKDLKRALHSPEREWVKTALGDYPSVFWGDFDRAIAQT